jgi:hypothetical protein
MIGPETKVGALLQEYPALEGVLIGMAPAFDNLRNPVLRKTIGKVATLEQAAKLGGIALPEMIRKLREAAGIGGDAVADGAVATAGATWLTSGVVIDDIDAGEMLSRGVHPIGRVREGAAKLKNGEVIRLTSAFRPEPLLDTMRRAGLEVYCEETAPGAFTSWFGK